MRFIVMLVTVVISWTYILGANATFQCYALSYRHINSQMEMAISRVYTLNGYEKDITPIIIAGFPGDATLKNNMDIYQYGENLHNNPAFWENLHGATANRYLYFMNYFGIDAIRFQDEDYLNIINNPVFVSMPVWPANGSVKMIQNSAVIKFSDEPAMP